MPKSTFLNLDNEKQKQFTQQAMLEFCQHGYDSASISRLVKTMSIAKGSVYQYFDDKQDLYLYLIQHAEQVKLKYVQVVQRADYPDFWAYYRALFENGINFDLEEPLCSLFLYRVGHREASSTVMPLLNSWKIQAQAFFTTWVEHEKSLGAFDQNISTDLIVHFMLTMSLSVAELLQSKYKLDFEQNIRDGKPLYGADKTELIAAVNDLVSLMQKALQP